MSNRLPPLCGSSTVDPHDRGSMPGCSCTPADPVDRARVLIRANPREYAAYCLGREGGWVDAHDGDCPDHTADKAAAYLLLADVTPDPAKPYTRADADALIRRSLDHQRALHAATDRVAEALHAVELDLDPTARAATEGALNVACAKLAALVGGAR